MSSIAFLFRIVCCVVSFILVSLSLSFRIENYQKHLNRKHVTLKAP